MYLLVSFLGQQVRSKPVLSVSVLWDVRTRPSFAAGLPEATSPASDLKTEVGDGGCVRTPSCGAGGCGARGEGMVLARAGLTRYPLCNRGLLLPRSSPPAPQTLQIPAHGTQARKLWTPHPRALSPVSLFSLGSSAF